MGVENATNLGFPSTDVPLRFEEIAVVCLPIEVSHSSGASEASHPMDTPVTPVEAIVDRISTTDLMQRYRLGSRTALTNRMKALGIQPYKDGKNYFVPVESVEELDALHNCLRTGKTIEQCVDQVLSKSVPEYSYSEPSNTEIALKPLALAGSSSPSPTSTIRLLRNQAEIRRFLREAAEHNEVLPTSELLPLLGLRSLPRNNGTFIRRGFTFTRVEPKVGREVEWKISRSSSP